MPLDDLRKGLLRVDSARIDRLQRRLTRKSTLSLLIAQLCPGEIKQVGHVGLVQDSEVGLHPDCPSVESQQSTRHCVEGATPHALRACADSPLHSPEHLPGCAP